MNRTVLLLILTGVLTTGDPAGAQVHVVAHRDVPVDTLSKVALLNYFSGDIQFWEEQTPVVVFDLRAKGRTRDVFYSFLGKTPARMKLVWMKKMLAGEGSPPAAFGTESELLEKVKSTPGALGFLAADSVDPQIKILLTIDSSEDP